MRGISRHAMEQAEKSQKRTCEMTGEKGYNTRRSK